LQLLIDQCWARWKSEYLPALAIVTRLISSKDGLVRSAVIKTKHGMTNRPITKLFPLEVGLVDDNNQSDTVSKDDTNKTTDFTHSITERPKREAAVNARTLIRKWSNELF
jgi:hypothetical protein